MSKLPHVHRCQHKSLSFWKLLTIKGVKVLGVHCDGKCEILDHMIVTYINYNKLDEMQWIQSAFLRNFKA